MLIPHLLNDRCALFQGDSRELRSIIGPNTVDALVTDPPAGVGFMAKGWDKDKGGRDNWVAWLMEIMIPAYEALKPGAHGLIWALPRTSHWTAYALEDAGFEIRNRVSHLFMTGFPKSRDLARDIDVKLCMLAGRHYDKNLPRKNRRPDDHLCPAHPCRDKYVGRRTALKEALEDWWLVRKPIEGTLAENVLRHDTGGLNIDLCRIGERGGTRSLGTEPNFKNETFGVGMGGLEIDPDAELGRWPPHLIVDEHATIDGIDPAIYFYVPKPTRKERDLGLDHLPIASGGAATGREDGDHGLNSPRAGSGRNGGGRNIHPTPKSVALMRWLCRLITPPGGLVLDVFAGSGTTGVAALAEGLEFLGVERGGDAGEYMPIICGRLAHALGINPAP